MNRRANEIRTIRKRATGNNSLNVRSFIFRAPTKKENEYNSKIILYFNQEHEYRMVHRNKKHGYNDCLQRIYTKYSWISSKKNTGIEIQVRK